MSSGLSFQRQPRAYSLPLAKLGMNCSLCDHDREERGEEKGGGREREEKSEVMMGRKSA